MSKYTVEEILDLYDPCRDHFVLIATSLEVSVLTRMLGMQLQKSPFAKMEVDSIGVRDNILAIWPTDDAIRKYIDEKAQKQADAAAEKIFGQVFNPD